MIGLYFHIGRTKGISLNSMSMDRKLYMSLEEAAAFNTEGLDVEFSKCFYSNFTGQCNPNLEEMNYNHIELARTLSFLDYTDIWVNEGKKQYALSRLEQMLLAGKDNIIPRRAGVDVYAAMESIQIRRLAEFGDEVVSLEYEHDRYNRPMRAPRSMLTYSGFHHGYSAGCYCYIDLSSSYQFKFHDLNLFDVSNLSRVVPRRRVGSEEIPFIF